MAKRSDFAQKLLDDLRLRKERMASSQRSNQSHSHHLPIDAFAYTKQTYRGSRNTKVTEIVSSRTGGEMLNRRHRSVNNGDLSNQIIPYQSSGNVSQALASAFENGGKLRRADFSYPNSIMGFLHQIKRGTNLDRQLASTSHYPTLSLVQINEISIGAQKLNHILRACSNGLNMDTYSLQFAKELLQGAIDLEESLRMLVDLQKNSEFVITSQAQNKNRIRLLDEEEDDDDDRKMEISKQMQLARPNFSFDKPSRHIQEVGKAISIQRPMTKEARNSNNEKKSVKKQVSQKRSTSSSSDILERQNQTTSNQEKGRIPNVIAKLMGLDNLPEKVEIGGNQGMASKHTAKGSTKKTELKNKQTVNLIPMGMATKNQKMVGVGALKMPEGQNEELMFGALLQKASSEVVVQNQNGKPLWRDPDGIKALTSFDKASTKMDKHNTYSAQKNLIRESQNDVQVIGRKQDHPNNSSREQKGTVKVRTNDPLLNNMLAQLEQVHERSELKSSIQVEKEIKGSIIQPEKKHTNKHILNKEKNPRNHFGVQKPYILSKNGPQEEKHHREQQLQLREEQMLMMRPQGGCDMTPKKSSKHPHQLINPQKKLNQATVLKKNLGENVASMKLESSHYDDHDLVRDYTSNDTNDKVGEIMNSKSGQISSPRDQGVERAKGRHGVKTLKDEKHVHKLARKKIKNTRKQRVDMPGRNGAKLISDKGKQQIPSLQEARRDRTPDKVNVLHGAEQERVNMFREADTCIISSNEPIAATVELDVKSQPRKEAELPPTLHSSGGGELQSQQESHYQDVKSVAINLQDQSVPVAVNEGFKTGEIALRKTNEILEDRVDTSIQQPLTESENYLKWILVMSQLFVNTAEALFKLNIPFSVLQGGGQDIQDEGSKLVLDCGYEVMKRKGIRQELRVHTCSKISISTVNIRSLDDLVRQLNEDMEKLKFYGRKNSQVDVEDYLPNMLEHDVYDKDPDIDCMWDLGWNDETFAFIEKYDVIRDTEKHILSVLLDEITGECCMLKYNSTE